MDINAAAKEASSNPRRPGGNMVIIAGYAKSCPIIPLSMSGNAVCKSLRFGKTIKEAKAIKIHGHGQTA